MVDIVPCESAVFQIADPKFHTTKGQAHYPHRIAVRAEPPAPLGRGIPFESFSRRVKGRCRIVNLVCALAVGAFGADGLAFRHSAQSPSASRHGLKRTTRVPMKTLSDKLVVRQIHLSTYGIPSRSTADQK